MNTRATLCARVGRRSESFLFYDAASRLIRREYPDGARHTFAYDAVRNRLTMQDGTGTATYAYSPVNVLEVVTYPGAKTITYTFDPVGNRETMTDPDGGMTTYAYDAANRIGWLLNPLGERTTFGYNAIGQPVTQQNANGTWVSWGGGDSHLFPAGCGIVGACHGCAASATRC